MDDPQLQRAIYASIQTARSQGYSVGGNGQAFRSSFTRGGGGGGSGGIGSRNTVAITRSTHQPTASTARAAANRGQPRSYGGSRLPGVGPMGQEASSRSLRSSYGHVESLRRDGIVPAAPGAAVPNARSNTPAGSHHLRAPTPSRGPPVAVPPRLAPSPPRLRNQQPQHPQQQQQQLRQHQQLPRGGAPPQLQQPHQQQQQPHQDRRRTVSRYHPPSNPVLEAIAAVTAEAHSALEKAATAPPLPPPRPPPMLRDGVSSGSAASPAIPAAAAAAAAAPVGGFAPPPRALVPIPTPNGGMVMVPEGVDPVLAQSVLLDAVTWDTGVTFDDIAGCERAKQLLHEAVALPLILPEFFTGIREPWRGVLLHGPPGTGKTLLAKAVARMVGGAFFAVSPSSLTSKWRGESEKLLATLFAVAQAHAPAIIFIDEMDALGGSRGGEGEHEASRRFKAELLQQMDGLASGQGVMVLAATNCPWDLDPALRRRLEKRIHIGLPDAPQRLALLQLHLKGVTLAPDVDLRALAAACEGLSGADIRLLCRDAAMAPLRRQIGGLTLSASNSASSPSLPPSSASQPQRPQSQEQQQQVQQQQQGQQPVAQILHSAADIRRLADSGELARALVVSARDLEVSRGSIRPSVPADLAARYEQWDREFAST